MSDKEKIEEFRKWLREKRSRAYNNFKSMQEANLDIPAIETRFIDFEMASDEFDKLFPEADEK